MVSNAMKGKKNVIISSVLLLFNIAVLIEIFSKETWKRLLYIYKTIAGMPGEKP